MLLVNVGLQVQADVCKGDGYDADGEGELGRGGQKWHFLWTFFIDEPVNRNLSRNFSRNNAKP